MRIALLQRQDGTVLRKIDEQWQYLSPLFGEWLIIFTPTQSEINSMMPYPSAINVPKIYGQEFIHLHEKPTEYTNKTQNTDKCNTAEAALRDALRSQGC